MSHTQTCQAEISDNRKWNIYLRKYFVHLSVIIIGSVFNVKLQKLSYYFCIVYIEPTYYYCNTVFANEVYTGQAR